MPAARAVAALSGIEARERIPAWNVRYSQWGGVDLSPPPRSSHVKPLHSTGRAATGTITLATGELAIDKNLTITGPGSITVDAGHASRVFHTSATVAISGLTVADGSNYDKGGGIYVEPGSTLNLTSCTFTGNTAGYGGGILSRGTLTVTDCSFSDNTATGGTEPQSNGGAIASIGGISTVSSSVFTGNSAVTDGGALRNDGGQMSVSNSTFTGNSANYGGGIYNGGLLAFGGTLTVNGCQTVKLHRGRLMRKLQLQSVAELVRLAEKARSLLPSF
jgi:predicted outer membrane repeat protein